MGKRGPQPQPIAVLKAKGTLNVTRTKDEIAAVDTFDWVHNNLPSPPEDLDYVAQQVWSDQLMQAQKLYGYISFIDLRLFKEYCYIYGEMEQLKVQSIDRYYEDENGVRRIDPLYQELNKLRKDFMRLSQEFGFSPSSRTRISLKQKPEEEKVDDYEAL